MQRLIPLFAASGAAALIYEIVWFQMLQLVAGSTAISLGVILATFMGGLCLGSLLLPRVVASGRQPLRVFALLEAGTAAFALAILFGMPYLSAAYAAVGGRALLAGLCLLPPTILMGATLPALARCVDPGRRGASWIGMFYGANIAGAVFGSLLAGFYLLRVYDMAVATYVAAGMNLVVAAIALVPLRLGVKHQEHTKTQPLTASPEARLSVYIAIALSGFAALGAEVIWTRLLSLILGASVYTFSIILAVFLIGLGLGSAAGSALTRRAAEPRLMLGICQTLAAASIAWAAYMLTHQLPYWSIDSLSFQFDFFRAALAILPAACLWGASFPLAVAAILEPGQDAGRLAGNVYAANTLGAIAGALLSSVVFVQFLGTQRAQQALLLVSAAAASIMLFPMYRARAVAATSVILLSWTISPVPAELVGYGRYTARTLALPDFKPNFLYVEEGLNASVAVSETPAGHRNFHVSGKIEASTEAPDMRLQRMLGHFSALSHKNPRSVLIVGFGAGITAGSFVTYPGIERIVICEIEPLIPTTVAEYFASQNYNVARDPRVEIVYDDARHFLLTTKEKFDGITSDPIHPWVKGAATLYSREYMELVKKHLNSGGVISQWVPLYQSSEAAVKSALATFFSVFPNGTVWSNDVGGRGYDVVLLAAESGAARPGALPDNAKVTHSLAEVGFASDADILARLLATHKDLASWLADAEINNDRNLRLQYLAGLGMNMDQGDAIYAAMLAHRGGDDLTSGRVLTPAQTAAILSVLKDRPRLISVSAVAGDEEAFRYATQLRHAIAAAGWQAEGVNRSVFSEEIPSILISVGSDPPPAAANELFRAFRAAGLHVEGSLNPGIRADSVLLFIGKNR